MRNERRLLVALGAYLLVACGSSDGGSGSNGGTSGSGGSSDVGGSSGTTGGSAAGGESPSAGGNSGSGGTGGSGGTAVPAELTLESSVVEDGGTLPAVHRCADAPSPPFTWSGAPDGTASFAIVMRDLDFGSLIHWVIYDMPPTTTELPEGVPLGYEPSIPAGAHQTTGLAVGYFGPCSPSTTNTYEFTLHAVDVATLPGVPEGTPGADVVTAIESHSLGTATLSVESGP